MDGSGDTVTANGAVAELTVEQKIDLLAWLHAEQGQKIAKTAALVATLMAQQMQPQVQQAILQRLMG